MPQLSTINWNTITTIERLKKIKKPWEKLNKIANNDCFFTSPDWLLLWVEIFWQPKWKLHVIVAFRDKQLVLLVPFYIHYVNNTKTLRFLGTGEIEIEEISSEYLDILCIKGYQSESLKRLSKEIILFSHLFQSIKFEHFLDNSLISQLFHSLRNHFYSKNTNIGTRYLIKVSASSWENYLNNLPIKSFKAKLQRSQKRFFNLENASYRILHETSEILAIYPEMVKLHQHSWSKKGKPGAFKTHKI